MVESYPRDCPVGRTMNLIGDRWAVMILRDLFRFKQRRFQDFLDALPGLSPNTLSARLRALESSGIIKRRIYEKRPLRAEYLLTDKGKSLGPVMLALKRWGDQHPNG